MSDPRLPALAVEDFGPLVEAVHGHRPFPWQEDLLGLALEDCWPPIRVPTGLGKTSIIDVAVFALAMQAHLHPSERTARTRTFFVIDRRLVVDDVTVHAERLRQRLDEALRADGEDVVARVAARLAYIAWRPTGVPEPAALHSAPVPLVVTRMRGGTTWAARWITRPEQPAVIVGTIDQLASRLLFRGYSVSRGSLPIDAALVGSDSLIILDEAHLARPLRATLAELLAWEGSVPQPVLPQRRPKLVSMSATVPPGDASPLDVSERDREDPEAGKRLRARKLTALWDLRISSARRPADARATLASALARAAERLAHGEAVSVVGVVCNTVRTARDVHDTLEAQGHHAELIIGPSREIDRELVMRRVRPAASLARERTGEDGSRARPLFVVATQTVEVGVNLDFDALATEVAPLDALAQRFGRLDRLGSRTERGWPTRAVVVHSGAVHGDDRLYGAPLCRTWQWLTSLVEPVELAGKAAADAAPLDSDLDLGPDALRDLMEEVDPEPLAAPSSRIVTVFPLEHLWELAQTSPPPRLDLDIEPFVRGGEQAPPSVLVAWRADVIGDGERAHRAAEASIALRPLAAQEQVEAPLWHVRAWLAGRRREASEAPLVDVPVGYEPDVSPADEQMDGITAFRVGEDGGWEAVSPGALRPGDALIVPADAGGLDRFGWNPTAAGPVIDVADLCETRAGVLVRLGTRTLSQLSPAAVEAFRAWSAARAGSEPLSHSLPRPTREDAQELAAALLDAVRSTPLDGRDGEYERLLEERLSEFAAGTAWDVELVFRPDPNALDQPVPVLRARRRVEQARDRTGPSAALDSEHRNDADDTTSLGPRRVTLVEHATAVRDRARACAERLGLPSDLVAVVATAGELHDLGKADPRFQLMLRGGDDLSYVEGDPVLAKSGMDPADRAAWRRAQREAGWPSGLRHEAVSLALLDALVEGGDSAVPREATDLVRHLVATHHGRSRPLFDPLPEPDFVDVSVEWNGRLAACTAGEIARYVPGWSAPGRALALLERHGAWGLALLEAVLRLADMSCSEAGT
jgi:CRISPR-associated endonuclease/helicase Cas3